MGLYILINSGVSALDITGACKDEKGNSVIKKWWNITEKDIDAMLANTEFSSVNRGILWRW